MKANSGLLIPPVTFSYIIRKFISAGSSLGGRSRQAVIPYTPLMFVRLLLCFMLSPLLSSGQYTGSITSTLISEQEYTLCKGTQPTFSTASSISEPLDIGTEKLFLIGKYDELPLTLFRSDKDSSLYIITDSGWAEKPLNYPIFSPDKTVFGSIGWLSGRPTIQLYKISGGKLEMTLAKHFNEMPVELGCITEKSAVVKFSNQKHFRISISP